ncbi:MAG: hypothetical protein J6M34_03765 [Clostridia bacterium]|nr:hypothetical protein [Clostridia bacterium]
MKKSFAGQEKNCLLCGIGTWVLFAVAMLLMNVFNEFFAYIFALLWIGLSLGAVVLAVGIRAEIGTKKVPALRWGMVLGTAMLTVQSFLLGLLVLQGQWKWESVDAGMMSLLIALFVTLLSVFLYLFFGRRKQLRIENDFRRKGDPRR